jgi:hypothetical protein
MGQQEPTVWTVEQLQYQEWLATPKKLRTPKTVEQMATKLGYERTSLWEWTKKPGWNKAVATLARESLHAETPAILEALGNRAMKGDVSAIKLALEVLGEYTPKQDVNVNGDLHLKGYVNVDPSDL